MRNIILLIVMGMINGCVETQPPGATALRLALELVDQGTAMMRQGDLTRARANYESAWEIAPSAQALDGQGCVAFLRGDFVAAQVYFSHAYSDFENYPEALANLALLYEAVGKRAAAQDTYRRALAEAPANFRGRNNYALFLEHSGAAPGQVLFELLKAEAVEKHPLITENIQSIGGLADE